MKRSWTILLVATLTACQPSSPPDDRLKMVEQPLAMQSAPGLTSDGQNLSFSHLASVSPPAGLQATDFTRFGDHLLVTYMSAGVELAGGVDIIDFSVPTNPRLVATWTTTDAEYARVLMVTDQLAYVFGAWGEGAVLTVLDVSDPRAPRVVGGLPFEGWFAITAERTADPNVIWVAVGDNLGVVEVDVSDPRAPAIARTHLLPNALSVAPPFALGGAADTAVYRLEGDRLDKVATLSSAPLEAPASLVLRGEQILSNASHLGLSVLSLRDGTVLQHETLPGRGNGLSLAGGYGVLAQGDAGTRLHGVCGGETRYVGSFDVPDDTGSANRATYAKLGGHHFLLLADGSSGFRIVRVELDNQLQASREYEPSRSLDARLNLFEPWTIAVPAKIPVVAGNAGNGTATLRFDDVVCTYRGGADQAHPRGDQQWSRGLQYELVACTNGAVAREPVTATCEVSLHIEEGDSDHSPTAVNLPLALLSPQKP